MEPTNPYQPPRAMVIKNQPEHISRTKHILITDKNERWHLTVDKELLTFAKDGVSVYVDRSNWKKKLQVLPPYIRVKGDKRIWFRRNKPAMVELIRWIGKRAYLDRFFAQHGYTMLFLAVFFFYQGSKWIWLGQPAGSFRELKLMVGAFFLACHGVRWLKPGMVWLWCYLALQIVMMVVVVSIALITNHWILGLISIIFIMAIRQIWGIIQTFNKIEAGW